MGIPEFLEGVVLAYESARSSRFPHPKISRGRSHTVSSTIEDLLAKFIVSNVPSVDAIYVDQSLSCLGEDRRTRFYPDLAVVSNGEVVAFIDLKMDIGWNRDGLEALCLRHLDTLGAVRGRKCRFSDGSTKVSGDVFVSPRATYCVVLMSRANIGGRTLDNQLAAVARLRPDVEVFVLCTRGANQYSKTSKEILDGIGPQVEEFSRLIQKLA